MGITVELWRARIGQFSGGRGSRPHSKAPSTKHQPLHFSDTVGTTAKVIQGGLLLLLILKFLSSQDKSHLLKRTRNAGVLVIAIVGLVHSLAHLLLLAGDIESNPGPQMDEVLAINDLKDVYEKLFKARTEWFYIGMTLGVGHNTLYAIDRKYSSDPDHCLRDMLAHRIKATDSLTWGEVCKTLRHDSVRRDDVADEIERSVSDDTLTLGDLSKAHTELYESRNRWFEIGQALNVDDVTLDSIRKQYANDGSTCLREVLAHRLKSEPPLIWKDLLTLPAHYGSSAQPVSAVLQGLMDKYQITTSQVDRKIQQKDIPYLASHFDNVNLYVDVMGLTPGEQMDVNGADTNQLAMIKCLNLWTRKNPAQATFRALLEMLVKLKKEEIAMKICQYSIPSLQSLQMPADTPEYKAISSCRMDLTERLSTRFKEVAERLRDSGALTDSQCDEIIESGSPKASARRLIDMIIVNIKIDPLEVFAEFVTAMKSSGNKRFKDFVKKNIEAKRKQLYRELLKIPPGFVASQEYDVFVSYSREADTMRTVDTLLCSRLTQEGLTVFVDRDGLRPGDRWRSEIASAIKTCKAFVCVLTKRYMRSVYCNGELYEAEALGKRMFPVVCENGWEGVLGGAPMREMVKEVQYVSLVAEDSETQLARLVQSIKGAVAPLSPLSPFAVAPDSPNLPTDQAGLLDKPADIQLPERTPLAQDEIDALQKLIEGTGVNIDDIIATGQGITLEEAQQLLAQKGHIEDAGNLKARLQEIAKEQQRDLEMLNDLITAEDSINLRYVKLFLVGPPFVGKTTTLSRLLNIFVNIHSAGDKAKLPSTLLANCIEAFAVVGDDTAEWLPSNNVDNEAQIFFNYLYGIKFTSKKSLDDTHHLSEQPSEKHTTPPKPSTDHEPHKQIVGEKNVSQVDKLNTSDEETKACKNQRISDVISQFQKLMKSGKKHSNLFNALGTFLNINDIGGQPGFLEMLPALSTGPAMYLVFLDLSKELNEPYKIPFSRDDTTITPYDAIHTVKDTVSQILSSISSVRSNPQVTSAFKTDKVDGFSEKLKLFQQISPLAALIGTHKDKLKDPENEMDQKIQKKSDDLKDIATIFKKMMISPEATSKRVLFTVDNKTGEQSDIAPLRKLLSEIFRTKFQNASLPIKPKWFLFGLILRSVYKIATEENYLELGDELGMDKNETIFCLRYLHDCVGTVMHYTSVPNDEEKWLKNHVICSPQVLFNSISELILPSLRVLHSGGAFTEYEREELIRMGQFSAKAIEEYCITAPKVKEKLENNVLIPAKDLISLLQHLNLLSEIVHTKDVKDSSKPRITYFMPAILECASQDELTNPPPPDANNPEPLLIKFSCDYVPTGTFCGLITRLVSQGPHGILGLTWELVEDSVKRNCVSFFVDKSNKVTLLAHNRYYEIQVVRHHNGRMSLHDLCTYVFSVMLYTLKSFYSDLVPQIAFQCPHSCRGHQSSRDNLCVFTEDFFCGRDPVTPTKDQQVWLGQTVSIGQSASLRVLRFMKRQSLERFSFNWSKVGIDDTQPPTDDCKSNVLTFQSVREEDLGYYQCEVKEMKAGKMVVVLTVYRALYKGELRECSGAAGQKIMPPVQTTQGPKVVLFGVLIIIIIYNYSWKCS